MWEYVCPSSFIPNTHLHWKLNYNIFWFDTIPFILNINCFQFSTDLQLLMTLHLIDIVGMLLAMASESSYINDIKGYFGDILVFFQNGSVK